MKKPFKDPTREELIAFLESRYSAVTCGETCHTEAEHDGDANDGCPCRFDIETAAYYLASHFHGGQSSNLYSALCASPYSPGPCERELPDNPELETAADLYREGARWIRNEPEPLCVPIDWTDDSAVKRLFIWQARNGVAPCAGTRPIAWYQAHHCAAYDIIAAAGSGRLQRRYTRVFVGGTCIGFVSDIWERADRKARGI